MSAAPPGVDATRSLPTLLLATCGVITLIVTGFFAFLQIGTSLWGAWSVGRTSGSGGLLAVYGAMGLVYFFGSVIGLAVGALELGAAVSMRRPEPPRGLIAVSAVVALLYPAAEVVLSLGTCGCTGVPVYAALALFGGITAVVVLSSLGPGTSPGDRDLPEF